MIDLILNKETDLTFFVFVFQGQFEILILTYTTLNDLGPCCIRDYLTINISGCKDLLEKLS